MCILSPSTTGCEWEREMADTLDEIAAFVRERDEALFSGDVDRVLAFHAKHNPGSSMSREIAEVAMHIARTAILTLPDADRQASRRWLAERGLSPLA